MTESFDLKGYVKESVGSYHWSRWKLGLMVVAGLFVGLGGVLGAVGGGGSDESRSEIAISEPDSNRSANRPNALTDDGSGTSSLLPRIGIDTRTPGTLPDEPTTEGPLPDGPSTESPGTDDESPAAAITDGEASTDWSPTLLKNGFGFFVAFAIGFALRTLFRISTLVIGVQLVALVVFSAAGWIDIRWDVMGGQFDQLLSGVGDQFESIETFIRGQIPTTAFSGAGLYTGLKKS